MRKWLILGTALIFIASAWAEAGNGQKGGALKVTSPGMILKVKTDIPTRVVGKKLEIPVPANKECNLPAGKYDVAGIDLYAQDPQKEVWKLESSSNLGSLKTVEITEGQTTTVEGGQPLTLKILATVGVEKAAAPAAVRGGGGCASVMNAPVAVKPPPAPKANAGADPPAVNQQKVVTVILRYVGKAGEEYSPKLTKATRPATPPAVRVVTYEGKTVGEGAYRFPVTYTTGVG